MLQRREGKGANERGEEGRGMGEVLVCGSQMFMQIWERGCLGAEFEYWLEWTAGRRCFAGVVSCCDWLWGLFLGFGLFLRGSGWKEVCIA